MLINGYLIKKDKFLHHLTVKNVVKFIQIKKQR